MYWGGVGEGQGGKIKRKKKKKKMGKEGKLYLKQNCDVNCVLLFFWDNAVHDDTGPLLTKQVN